VAWYAYELITDNQAWYAYKRYAYKKIM